MPKTSDQILRAIDSFVTVGKDGRPHVVREGARYKVSSGLTGTPGYWVPDASTDDEVAAALNDLHSRQHGEPQRSGISDADPGRLLPDGHPWIAADRR